MNKGLKVLFVWAYGLVAAFLGGAATVILSMAGGVVIGAADFTWRQAAMVGLSGGVVAVLGYMKQSPLPKIDDLVDFRIGGGE